MRIIRNGTNKNATKKGVKNVITKEHEDKIKKALGMLDEVREDIKKLEKEIYIIKLTKEKVIK